MLVVGVAVRRRRSDEAVAVEVGEGDHERAARIQVRAAERMSRRRRCGAVGQDDLVGSLLAGRRQVEPAGDDLARGRDARRGRRDRGARRVGPAGAHHEVDVADDRAVDDVVAAAPPLVGTPIDQRHAGQDDPRRRRSPGSSGSPWKTAGPAAYARDATTSRTSAQDGTRDPARRGPCARHGSTTLSALLTNDSFSWIA